MTKVKVTLGLAVIVVAALFYAQEWGGNVPPLKALQDNARMITVQIKPDQWPGANAGMLVRITGHIGSVKIDEPSVPIDPGRSYRRAEVAKPGQDVQVTATAINGPFQWMDCWIWDGTQDITLTRSTAPMGVKAACYASIH